MSLYDDARDLVIEGLDSIIDGATPETFDDGIEESVRGIHVQSIVYRLMDQV